MKGLLIFFLILSSCFSLEENPYDIVNKGENFFYVAPSGSMRPTFNERNLLIIQKLPFKDIIAREGDGDIIIVKLKEPVKFGGLIFETLCHRAIRKSSNGNIIVTKGDANEVEDSFLVTEENYLGTVIAIVRKENLDTEEDVK